MGLTTSAVANALSLNDFNNHPLTSNTTRKQTCVLMQNYSILFVLLKPFLTLFDEQNLNMTCKELFGKGTYVGYQIPNQHHRGAQGLDRAKEVFSVPILKKKVNKVHLYVSKLNDQGWGNRKSSLVLKVRKTNGIFYQTSEPYGLLPLCLPPNEPRGERANAMYPDVLSNRFCEIKGKLTLAFQGNNWDGACTFGIADGTTLEASVPASIDANFDAGDHVMLFANVGGGGGHQLMFENLKLVLEMQSDD